MKKKLLLIPLLTLSLSSCGSRKVEIKSEDSLKTVQKESEKYANIFLDDRIENQWEDYGIGDPFIYRFNGWYYLICSTKGNETGVKGWKSKDLMQWTMVDNGSCPEGYIVSPSIRESFDAYASEVYYLDGTFYLIESSNGKGHYIFSSASPEGPFELLSNRIDDTIDGSLFLDTDGQTVMLNAAASNLNGKRLSEDMKSVLDSYVLPNTSMQGWTEGPEYLVKDGVRYYFYTGNGVTQKAYRIDYSYSPIVEGKTYDESPIYQGHNILLNTDEDFNSLGHGTVFLGPDLDSYYLGFHNMLRKGNHDERRFNLGRLLFNGTEISMQHIGVEGNIVPALPDYQEFDPNRLLSDEGMRLSPSATDEEFTVEYNFVGNGKLVFSYVDPAQYGYVLFDGSTLSVHRVQDGKTVQVGEAETYRSYSSNVMHSIRLGYKDGLMDLSFDNLEIANDIAVGAFSAGKVGYENTFSSVGTLTFNNTAQGDSDKKTEKIQRIPSPSYSEKQSRLSDRSGLRLTANSENDTIVVGSNELKIGQSGDYATYLIYAPENGSYGLDMVVRDSYAGKKVGVQIDGGDIVRFTLPATNGYSGYMRLHLGDLTLTEGNHNLTIFGLEDEFAYQMMYLEPNYNVKDTVYEHDLKTYPSEGISYPTFFNKDGDGFYSDTNARYLVTFGNVNFEDLEISVDITLTGVNGTGTCGLVLAADNWAFNNVDLDNFKSIQGYYFAVNANKATIVQSDYQYSDESCRTIVSLPNDVPFNLKAVKQGKTLSLYIDGEQILETFSPMGRTRGAAGIYANFISARYNNLKIRTL